MVGGVLPVAALSVFTRVLTREEYGAWALAVVYGVFVTGLANFGLTLSYERNFFQYRAEKERAGLLYSTVAFVLATLVLCACVTWLFRGELANAIIGSAAHGSLLFWAFCATGVASVKQYYLIYLKNIANAAAHVRYTLLENVLNVMLSLFLVAYLRIGVLGLVVGQLLASALVLAFLMVRFLRLLPLAFSGRLLIESLKISYPLTPRIFMGVIGREFDKYLIGLIGSVGGVGVYVIGQRIAKVVFSYMTALQNVFAPQVYEQMFSLGDQGGESIGRYLTPFAYFSIAVALLVALFAEEVVTALTPESYHGATVIVSVLVMYYGIMFFGKQPQLIFTKKTYLVSLLTMISIGMSVAFNIVGIRLWGAVGAAWGTLVAGLISGALSFVVAQRYYEIRWQYGRLGAMFGLLFAAALVVIVMGALGVDYWVRVVVKVLLVGLYLWLGVRLKVLSRANLVIVREALTGRLRRRYGLT